MPDEPITKDGLEPTESTTDENETMPEWAQAAVKKANDQAAKQRVELRDARTQLAELKPLAEEFNKQREAQKSEEQKLRDQLEAAKAENKSALAAAEMAKKEARLAVLAGKAGVNADLAALLDLSKLDLDDEEKTLNTLKKLITTRPTGGGASNPATIKGGVETPAEWFAAQTGRRSSIFGG